MRDELAASERQARVKVGGSESSRSAIGPYWYMDEDGLQHSHSVGGEKSFEVGLIGAVHADEEQHMIERAFVQQVEVT